VMRKAHDKAFDRWMPHINLLFPFVTEETLADRQAALLATVQALGPFHLTFVEIDFFAKREEATIVAKPLSKPVDALDMLHKRLLEVFPECRRTDHPFVPHLTLGQCAKSQVASLIAKYETAILPGFTFEVTSLEFVKRTADAPFTVFKCLPLNPSIHTSDPRDSPTNDAEPDSTAAVAAAGASRRPFHVGAALPDRLAWIQRASANFAQWVLTQPPRNHPRTRAALLGHLGLNARVKLMADPDKVLGELVASGFVARNPVMKQVEPLAHAPARGFRQTGRGRGRGRGSTSAPPAKTVRYTAVTLLCPAEAEAVVGGPVDVILRELKPASHSEFVRRAQAWVVRLRRSTPNLRMGLAAFVRCLTQICTVSVPLPAAEVFSYLLAIRVVTEGPDGALAYHPEVLSLSPCNSLAA
jgi:2'-5' RNA ligase